MTSDLDIDGSPVTAGELFSLFIGWACTNLKTVSYIICFTVYTRQTKNDSNWCKLLSLNAYKSDGVQIS